jgi:hypothetical protein
VHDRAVKTVWSFFPSACPPVDSQQIFSFYMGKNTPERKDYIMENLVVTVEE